MTVIRVIAEFESASGLPQDSSMNVWHFGTNDLDPGSQVADIDDKLQAFYDDIAAIYSANTISENYSFKFYDLEDVPPRVPMTTITHVLAGAGEADALPTECAIVLSYSATPESGVDPRRRRGRLYLGPIDQGVSETADGLVFIGGSTLTLITAAANNIVAGNDPFNNSWIVFSPTTAGAPPWDGAALSAASAVVTQGYVDNAFDTQRRRGTAPTVRTTFGV